MKIEHITLTHPGQVFTMGVDDPGRLKSSELKVLICPNTAFYSQADLQYAMTRLRAGTEHFVFTTEGSWPAEAVREIIMRYLND